MTNRYRANFLYGTLSGFNATQTTFTGTGFPNVPTGYYLPIVINPGYQGGSSTGEIVYVTAVTSGTIITVSGRAFENTTAITGSQGTPWIAGPLVSDFGIANSISNGDFPTPASGGQYFTSVGTTSGQWTSTIPGSTVSGYSANVSITGTQISGTVASATTAANFTGTLNAATITGGNLPSAVQVSGSSIVGYINVPVSGTIAASNITAATWQSNVVFPGTQISGTISGVTISGSNINNATISGATFSQPLTKLWTYSTDVGALPTGTGGFGSTTVSGYNNYLVTAIANPVFTTSGLTNAISISVSGSQYGQVNFIPPKNTQFGVSTHYAFAAIPSSPVVVNLQLGLNNTTSSTPLTLQIIGMS